MMKKAKGLILHLVSVLLVFALLFTFTTPVLAEAVTVSTSAADNTSSNAADNADGTVQGNIIGEDKTKRDEYTKYFVTDAGTTIAAQYSIPVHYKNDNGEYVDFDNSLTESKTTVSVSTIDEATLDEASLYSLRDSETLPQEAETFTNKKSNSNVSFLKKSGNAKLIEITRDGHTVSWGYSGANIVTAKEKTEKREKLTGNDSYMSLPNLSSTLRYNDIYNGVDLEVINSTVGIKENIILKSSNANNEFKIDYNIDDLVAISENSKTISLKDAEGKTVYTITAPYMADADGNTSQALELKILANNKGKLSVKLIADKEWLKDASRVYPVTVDPSFIYGQNNNQIRSTYVDSSQPNTDFEGHGSIYQGTYGSGYYETYLRVKQLPTLGKGDMIIDATLNQYLCDQNFYTTSYVGVYEMTSAWPTSGLTWNSKPSCSSELIDYEVITSADGDGWKDWNITELVKGWYNGTTNHGLALKIVPNTDNVQCIAFMSSSNPSFPTARPCLVITYRNNKGLENYWTYTPFGVGAAGSASVNDYSGNLVFSMPVESTYGVTFPANVNFVYNSYLADKKNSSFSAHTGKGWRMNIQQTLLPTSSKNGLDTELYPYVYTDEDGTEHYFKKVTENSKTKYLDEDGLNLELKVNSSSYTITDKDKNKWNFKSNGMLSSIEDSAGKKITLSYRSDDATCVSSITDADGKAITFSINNTTNKYINKITNSDGKSTTFTYGTNARLATVTRFDGKQISFGYNDSGQLTSATNTDGAKLVFSYASTGSKGVASVQEYGTDGTTAGQKLTFDRTKYNTTIIRTSGKDYVYGNSDDIITEQQFDECGRTIAMHNKVQGTGESLGAAFASYTAHSSNSSGSNIRYLNKVTRNYSFSANTENLAKNHNMESLTSWTKSTWLSSDTANATFTTSNGNYALYSKKSLLIDVTEVTGDARGRVYQDVPITAGKTYTLSAYVKTSGISGATSSTYGAVIAATAFANSTSCGTFYSDHISTNTDTQINNGFRRLTVTFTAPSNATKVRIQLALRGTLGKAYFDAVQLEKGDAPSTYNMLENASLENYQSSGLPTSWTSTNLTLSDTADKISEAHVDGAYSFRIKGDVSANKYVYQDIPVNIGATEADTYILSGWATAASVPKETNSSSFKLLARVYFTDGTYQGTNAYFNSSLKNSQWQYTCTPFTLSDGTDTAKTPSYIRIYLIYNKQGNYGYFDNIQLTKEAVPSYTYDVDGNMVSVVDNAEQKSDYEYSDNLLTKYVSPNGGEYNYDYNDKNQLTSARTPRGVTFAYTYDSATGLPNSVEASNTSSQYGIYLKAEVDYEYNSDKTRYTVTASDQDGNSASTVTNANNGLTLSTTDVNGNTTTNTYNSANLLTQIQFLNQSVQYTYDTDYRLSTIAHHGTTYAFGYDVFGNRTTTSVGNRTLSTNTYGANNGARSRMDYGNGQYVSYTYDIYGNISTLKHNGTVVGKSFADSSGSITRTQDLINNTETRVSYDHTGRLVSKDVSAIGASSSTDSWLRSFEYDFDLNNNLSKLTFADKNLSHTYTYTYESDDVPSSMTIANSKSTTPVAQLSYNYDPLGRTQSKLTQLPNNKMLSSYYTYADSQRTTEGSKNYTTTKLQTEETPAFGYYYEYDNAGNITEVYKGTKDSSGGYTYNFSSPLYEYVYDDYNQLTSAVNADDGTITYYYYDNSGNITRKITREWTVGLNLISDITYTYGDSQWKDLLTAYNGQTITYDAIGNPLNYRDGISLTWQNGRKLATYADGANTINYTYDIDGMRTAKSVTNSAGTTTDYTYVYENGLLMQMTKGTMSLTFSYDANGTPVGFALKQSPTSNPVYYYYGLNQMGDIVALYNSAGSIYGVYHYDAYGKLLTITNASGGALTAPNHPAVLNPLRYRGYVHDAETGLYYVSSRYYDPEIGRWINADGFVSTGQDITGYNMFAYCGNNPVNRKDPTGQFWITALIVTAVVAVCTVTLSGCSAQPTKPSNYVQENSTNQNCYSYAFDLPHSANPGDYSVSGNSDYMFKDKNIYTPEEITGFIQRDMDALNKSVRVVDSPKDKFDNEYIVAMKTSTIVIPSIGVADYHFAVQLSDGSWADKPGQTPSRWNVLDGAAIAWDLGNIKNYYNTETVYFAVER